MTTEEILKLAEFDPWDLECDVGNRLFKVEGAKWQHARLLPIIRALAESNEKLVEALEIIMRTGDLISRPKVIASEALAAHAERMEKLK